MHSNANQTIYSPYYFINIFHYLIDIKSDRIELELIKCLIRHYISHEPSILEMRHSKYQILSRKYWWTIRTIQRIVGEITNYAWIELFYYSTTVDDDLKKRSFCYGICRIYMYVICFIALNPHIFTVFWCILFSIVTDCGTR